MFVITTLLGAAAIMIVVVVGVVGFVFVVLVAILLAIVIGVAEGIVSCTTATLAAEWWFFVQDLGRSQEFVSGGKKEAAFDGKDGTNRVTNAQQSENSVVACPGEP